MFDQPTVTSGKRNFYYLFVFCCFLVLTGRFYYLQIHHQELFLQKSRQNSVRVITEDPPRGLIFDRKGNLLVDNRPSYSIFAIPSEIKNDSLILLSSILKMDEREINQKIVNHPQFLPVKLKRQIDYSMLTRIEENRLELPGIGYTIEPQRFYPAPLRSAHVLGYLGEITESEASYYRDYQLGDVVGKNGLERKYEDLLKGNKGFRFVRVDVRGRELSELVSMKDIPPRQGINLHLYLDSQIQAYAESLMVGRRGSIVMLDARSGGILAMVSSPDYDPRRISGIVDYETWQQLVSNPEFPLFNRAIQSTYPPGSTFKLITAIASIEKNVVSPYWTVNCPGYFAFGNRVFRCWNAKGHGTVNLFSAIEGSCNVYFYQLGLKLGLEEWTEYARIFQFGVKTEVDLVNEKSGFVPGKDFYDRRYGVTGWTKGNMLNVAVGQGEVLATPIQMARFIMMIANGGEFYQPHLVEYTEDPVTREIQKVYVEPHRIRNVSAETYKLIKEGLRKVVASGTGREADVYDIEVAGKTGTAQNPHGKPHAWFIGFAPFKNPEVALAVIIENGGGGGAIAAPVAEQILELYFHGVVRPKYIVKSDSLKMRVKNKPLVSDTLVIPE